MVFAAAAVTDDFPLLGADWLPTEAGVVTLGGAALVMAARHPSGLVPYCTGWKSLRQKNTTHKLVVSTSVREEVHVGTSRYFLLRRGRPHGFYRTAFGSRRRIRTAVYVFNQLPGHLQLRERLLRLVPRQSGLVVDQVEDGQARRLRGQGTKSDKDVVLTRSTEQQRHESTVLKQTRFYRNRRGDF